MTPLKKQVALCALGTLFEWYDFSLFACLTPILSQIFFHHNSYTGNMMSVFAIFGAGYVMRPLGAIFFGHLGDQLGRKYSLLITIFTMTIATSAIGLIPTEWQFATVFLVICRLIQGFASSGEYPGVLALLSEQPKNQRKTFIISTGVAATGIGSFFGALTYVILNKCLGAEQMLAWGWRIPFLLGMPLGIIGYFLRKHIFESKEFSSLKEKKLTSRAPLLDLLRYHSKNLFAVLSISILMNTIIYMNFIYFGNYALSIHKITAQQAIYLTLLFTFFFSISILFFAYLADFVNKYWLLIGGYVLIMLSAYPLCKMILMGSISQQFFGQAILALLLGVVIGPYSSILPEQFPTKVRYSGLSITLNFAASIFGGSAPIVCGWLTQLSGMTLMPAFYILFLGVFSLYGIIFIGYSHLHPKDSNLQSQLCHPERSEGSHLGRATSVDKVAL